MRPETFAAAKIGNGFQQVGLSLGVVAHDQIDAGLKFQLRFPVITEGAQAQLFQVHAWLEIR